MSQHEKGEEQVEGKGEADSLLNGELDRGLDPKTLRSCPELKADALPTEPLNYLILPVLF